MSELISWMIRYMENDRFSKWQKLSRLLWVLFVAFVIDNAFGLSSIVYNSFKLDYLVKVEDARRRFGSDKELGYVINCMHEDVVYHKSARGFSKKCGNIMEIVIKDKIRLSLIQNNIQHCWIKSPTDITSARHILKDLIITSSCFQFSD